MRTLILFTCICLFAFAQERYFVQTTSSISNIDVFIKEWIQEIRDLQKNDIYPINKLIFFVDDSNIGGADQVPKDDIKGFDNVVNNKGGHAVSIDRNKNNNNSNTLITPIKEIKREEKHEDLKSTFERNNVTISNKFNEQTDKINNSTCTEKNERYSIPGSCDRYIQCQNGTAEEKQCPDGLRYNHNIKSSDNPCQYPADVQCTPGSSLQPPKPTDVCPNQFGYFKTEDRFNCSSFRICENGVGYDYNCPEGLAFSTLTYRCDWPDRVPECNIEALLGYRCPEVPTSKKNVKVSRSYRSPTDCRIYFSCINRKPRRLECDKYFGFDEISQTCVPAYIVPDCSDEVKDKASQLVRRNANGEYVLIREDDDNYLINRWGDLSFTPIIKRPKIIS